MTSFYPQHPKVTVASLYLWFLKQTFGLLKSIRQVVNLQTPKFDSGPLAPHYAALDHRSFRFAKPRAMGERGQWVSSQIPKI